MWDRYVAGAAIIQLRAFNGVHLFSRDTPLSELASKRIETVVDLPARNLVWLQGIEYARLQDCDAEWAEYGCSVRDVCQGSSTPSAEVSDMLNVDLLLGPDTGSTTDVGASMIFLSLNGVIRK